MQVNSGNLIIMTFAALLLSASTVSTYTDSAAQGPCCCVLPEAGNATVVTPDLGVKESPHLSCTPISLIEVSQCLTICATRVSDLCPAPKFYISDLSLRTGIQSTITIFTPLLLWTSPLGANMCL